MFEKKVLIIDDEVDICFLLSNILKRQYFEVSIAHYISTGLIKLAEVNPDILFLDINLPDGSGLDIIQAVKASYPNLIIIVISAYDTEKAHAYEKGAHLFISKPLNNQIIRKSLEEMHLVEI